MVWALALALILVGTIPVKWWHPYCNNQSDGPGYFAEGFPLPFKEFGGVSSLEYVFLPRVYGFDLLLMWGALLPLTIITFRRIGTNSRVGASLLIGAVSIVTLIILTDVWLISIHGLIPSDSISGSDSYFSHRPWTLVRMQGYRTCDPH